MRVGSTGTSDSASEVLDAPAAAAADVPRGAAADRTARRRAPAGWRVVGDHAVRPPDTRPTAIEFPIGKRAGLTLRIRGAEAYLATRMYRSLGQIVSGWSKNIVLGGLQSLPRWLRPLMPPVSLGVGLALWIAPPLALVGALAGVGGTALLTWAATVCAVSLLIWTFFSRQMGAPLAYGLLYPLGATMGAYIFARSWARGRRVEWKGRTYELPGPAEGA